MIIATGGPGMVKAAYSSGKPALGVGAGNSPAYIERTADVPAAVRRIMASKTFDNGTICASEQSVICETCNATPSSPSSPARAPTSSTRRSAARSVPCCSATATP